MSFFSTIQSSANALKVNQLGLQVVGNNIANVNTPGYIRQDIVQASAPSYRIGNLTLGMGVEAVGVKQRVDNVVLERMRTTLSQLSYHESLEASNADLESLLQEMTDTDLSSRMSEFANAFQDIANQPENESIRSILIARGQELASQIANIANNVQDTSYLATNSLSVGTTEINNLTKAIANLNQRIVELEAGSNSDAVGLRDERIKALEELASYINISTQEQANGSVSVFVSGEYIVTDSLSRQVRMVHGDPDNGIPNELRFVDTNSKVNLTGGSVLAYQETSNVASHSGFLDRLNSLAKDIIYAVNRVHSQGQGMEGFESVVSEISLSRNDIPLKDAVGSHPLVNGSFELVVKNEQTQQTTKHLVSIRQSGTLEDTTADGLVSFLNSIEGIEASVNSSGKLIIESESNAYSFGFGADSSGVLAAVGINTFFIGDSATTIAVRPGLVENPRHLAASTNGVGNGGNNAIRLAEVFTKPQIALNGKSINNIYDTFVTETTMQAATQKGVSDGLRNFYQSLESKHLSISGVNLDEEAVKMILYQRAFQAQSRVVSIASEMLDTLVNII